MLQLGHLSPVLAQLSELHNFTIESQVRFHAPLAFEPQSTTSDDEGPVHGLTPEDLTVFVNSAEWTLCEFLIYLSACSQCRVAKCSRRVILTLALTMWMGSVKCVK